MVMTTLHFWNGNKTSVRQAYEYQLLMATLQASGGEYASSTVVEDTTDYPCARDEGAILRNGSDVCVTVAGNPKFAQGDYLPVYQPLMFGLLGHRLMIIRESDQAEFAHLTNVQQLQQKIFGVPATWADAQLFRDNHCRVNEEGDLVATFRRLKAGECDYVALGANEVFATFKDVAQPLGGLTIAHSVQLYYPFALVFYVNPDEPALARSLELGLHNLASSGRFKQLFGDFCAAQLQLSQLSERREIGLHNPQIPKVLLPTMALAKQQILNFSVS